jgi:flagella synthesis protein FlgN
MQIKKEISQQLLLLLKSEIQHANKMLDILQQENIALRENDLSAFEAILTAKHQQADLLDEFEKKIGAINNIPESMKNLANCISFIEQGSEPHITETWIELQEVLRLCQTQNMINSQVVEASKIHIQESLNILHGGQGVVSTYEASGKTGPNSSSGSLAIA